MPSKGDYIIIGVGALAAVLIASYVPSLVKAVSLSALSMESPTTLESVPGIDLQSLNIIRQNELSQYSSIEKNKLWQTETGY